MDNFVQPPVGNTGVTRTEKEGFDLINKSETNNLGQFVLIDWLEFTIHYDLGSQFIYYDSDTDNPTMGSIFVDEYVRKLFKEIFGISNLEYQKRGRNGYTDCYIFRNIMAWTSTRIKMGIHFEITGQGCRDLEELGIDLFDLLERLNHYAVQYSRIDLSIDDFTDKYYTISKIKKYLMRNLIVSKIRSFYTTQSGMVEDYNIMGNTIQLGSKASLIHITFYDKLKERESNNYIVPDSIKFWTRTEVRFRHEKATDVVNHLIENRKINPVVKGVLRDYIRFVDKPKSSNDTNKRRYNTAPWWNDFLENIDSLELMPIKTFTSIQKKKVWLNDSVSKSEFMVLLSELENIQLDAISSGMLLYILKNGYSKLTQKDMNMINDERIKNKMLPISKEELDSYLRDLKDIILIKQNDNYLE